MTATEIAKRKDAIIAQLQQNPRPDERARLNQQLLKLHRGQPLDPDKMQPFNRQREENRVWPDHERLEWIRENVVHTDEEKLKIDESNMYSYLYDRAQPAHVGEEFRDLMIDKLESAGLDASSWKKAQKELAKGSEA